ncbi:hypothetical protein DLJ53_32195 [Acuticoccus sediminis]|uniref:Glycosyl hydrolase family 32 n=1 Tax=Acuticoccus sediminis TaxID=2184697 RepID=A0A8B2NKK5_9HYPH|nr:hypothetical protein [Acuticoccus sediminis]RAH96571.1 hypothetical protein DLJ53_32195 [Acuticoccus sediminis]
MPAPPPSWSLVRSAGRPVLAPPAGNPLWASHAQAPTVLPLGDGTWRVFLAGRDRHNVSRIFAADVDPKDMRAGAVGAGPVLDVGAPGSFDEHGIGPGTAVRDGERVLLYYMGLGRRADVPYRPGIGLAESRDGGASFTRVGDGPLIEPSPHVPLGAALPTVFRSDAVPGCAWGMWFSRFTEWALVEGKPEPVYDLLYAASPDGLAWTVVPDAGVPLESGDEGGLVRAAVRRTGGGWLMLFAARGREGFREDAAARYRLVAATSADGLRFTRRPGALALSPPPAAGDWDGEMQAYPQIVEDGGRTLVLYNGNGFGRLGFGVAELVGGPATAR